jgi:hypothetical protein
MCQSVSVFYGPRKRGPDDPEPAVFRHSPVIGMVELILVRVKLSAQSSKIESLENIVLSPPGAGLQL